MVSMMGIERQSDYYSASPAIEEQGTFREADAPTLAEVQDLLGGPRITPGMHRD